MCKYKHSLTKIETLYIVALLNGTNRRLVDIENVDSYRQFFVSDPKGL